MDTTAHRQEVRATALVQGGTLTKKTRKPVATILGSAAALLGSGLIWTAGPAQAAFPGINGKIACASFRDGNSEIYSFNPDGTELEPTRLTDNFASDSRPRYSPDGRQIVFESNRSGNLELWIMNADGSNPRQLTITGGNSSGNWSPGGDQIVYQTTRFAGGSFEIAKINVDGTGDTRLTNNPAEDSLPAWSPDGTKIAFSSRRTDPAADVHLMNPDGTDVVDVTNSPGEDSWPAFTPDGSQIVFHSRLDDPIGEEIYRINLDGTGRTRLTFNNPQVPTIPFDIFPAVSPDGTRFVWNSGRAGGNFGEVYTANLADGSDVRRITSNPAVDQRCDWQPLCTIYGSGNIIGTEGDDIICGSDGPDSIAGLGGNDRILGLGGDDRINAGAGDDMVFGGLGNDSLFGGDGVDRTDGGVGLDRCLAELMNSCP